MTLDKSAFKIGIIGLGYVGLPLAVAFGRHFKTVGLDIDKERVESLKKGVDTTLEVSEEVLKAVPQLSYTTDLYDIKECNFFIITVPTPIDAYKRPDLGALEKSSAAIGTVIKKGDIVVYESTVYPGVSEEICVPILEEKSGLTFNEDFFVGYSPERINPGDKEHTVTDILKVVSGSTPETLETVDALYRTVITAGTHRAKSIRVAEAAKVIENTQRDVNIALINELALIFNRLGIDTEAVLKAAGTKWNFLPFTPGLVGGHCIGVDPYYLTHKAQEVGYHPEVILAGRRINDNMGKYVAGEVIKLMTKKKVRVGGSHILVLGITFKENCPDIRNTRVIDILEEFSHYGVDVDVYDPWADVSEVKNEYGITLVDPPRSGFYDAIVLAVSHHQFTTWSQADLVQYAKPAHVVYDIKHLFDREWVDGRL
ncbi:UDP-N-acetyl-D-glucosamine 6-dehydrogenase [hydrothermal vent metagenome]|uniref:UDP-N-acetyl-D-glucosamine 6-dehydrogenase n=1 Tax=hydrothermal vent metagenome TaxID=652676 RepID=A0A3B1DC59_9ZZZZ